MCVCYVSLISAGEENSNVSPGVHREELLQQNAFADIKCFAVTYPVLGDMSCYRYSSSVQYNIYGWNFACGAHSDFKLHSNDSAVTLLRRNHDPAGQRSAQAL